MQTIKSYNFLKLKLKYFQEKINFKKFTLANNIL